MLVVLIGVVVGIITPVLVSQLPTMKTIVTFWSVLYLNAAGTNGVVRIFVLRSLV